MYSGGSMYEDWLIYIPNQELAHLGRRMKREQTRYMAYHNIYQSARQRNV